VSSSVAARKPLAFRPAATARSRPKLVVVASRRVVGRTPFVVLVGTLLLAGLIALLMLHTLAAQDAFRQTSLQQRLATLTDAEQHLEQQVQLDSAPDALRVRAKALGMVPSVVTGYHRLPNGRVIAHEVAANSAAGVAASTMQGPATQVSPTPAASSPSTAATSAATTKPAPSASSPTTSTTSTTTGSATTASAHHHHRGTTKQ
jgi:cell division septation protein DedD